MCTVKGDVATLTYGYHNLMRQIKRLILIIKNGILPPEDVLFKKKHKISVFPTLQKILIKAMVFSFSPKI